MLQPFILPMHTRIKTRFLPTVGIRSQLMSLDYDLGVTTFYFLVWEGGVHNIRFSCPSIAIYKRNVVDYLYRPCSRSHSNLLEATWESYFLILRSYHFKCLEHLPGQVPTQSRLVRLTADWAPTIE